MTDSGSNVHLIPNSLVAIYGIPNRTTYQLGNLNGIGSGTTLGHTPLLFATPMAANNKLHVYSYPKALIIPDHIGPRGILLSTTLMEKQGYSWSTSAQHGTLYTPSGEPIPLSRHPNTNFWMISLSKEHHLLEPIKNRITNTLPPPSHTFITTQHPLPLRNHCDMKIPKLKLHQLLHSASKRRATGSSPSTNSSHSQDLHEAYTPTMPKNSSLPWPDNTWTPKISNIPQQHHTRHNQTAVQNAPSKHSRKWPAL